MHVEHTVAAAEAEKRPALHGRHVVAPESCEKRPAAQGTHALPLNDVPRAHAAVGAAVGEAVGVAVGATEGVAVGACVGVVVGLGVGAGVGAVGQYVALPLNTEQFVHTVAAGRGAYVPLPHVSHWKAPEAPE
jgi:hypothetical protein